MFDKTLTVKERQAAALTAIQENIKDEIRFLVYMGKSRLIHELNNNQFYTSYKKDVSLRCIRYGLDFRLIAKELGMKDRQILENELMQI